MTTRNVRIAAGMFALGAVFLGVYARSYPADTTPEGAYLRMAKHLELGQPQVVFSYLEVAARDATYAMARTRTESLAVVRKNFPADEVLVFTEKYGAIAVGDNGPQAFARYAEARGWVAHLTKGLSPIEHVENDGDLATVVTATGGRYVFHRDPDGRYGLTFFTAELVAQAQQALRDREVILRSGVDYERRRQGEKEGEKPGPHQAP